MFLAECRGRGERLMVLKGQTLALCQGDVPRNSISIVECEGVVLLLRSA